MSFLRPNVFEIDLNAVRLCTQQIRSAIGPDARFFATLKADAYGFGLLPVARTVLGSGADALSLTSLDDAIRLRQAGVQVPILLYAGSLPTPEVIDAVQEYRLIPTIHNEETLQAYRSHVRRDLAVAVKVDVGPERIGVPAEDAADFIARVQEHPLLSVDVVNAHPNIRGGARAMECLEWQQHCFEQVLHELDQRGIAVKWRAMASSKVLKLTGRRMVFNAVDPGAALFGGLQDVQEAAQPFRSLKSVLIETRSVKRSQYLDEAPFEVRAGMRIGVIPFGYSDSVHRLHGDHVLVRGQLAPIVGKAALEYLRIDISAIPDACTGDDVVLIGRQGGRRIAPETVMAQQKAARVIDLALQVGPAIERRYIAGDTASEPSNNQPGTPDVVTSS